MVTQAAFTYLYKVLQPPSLHISVHSLITVPPLRSTRSSSLQHYTLRHIVVDVPCPACVLDTLVSHANRLIEMSLGMYTLEDPKNHVFDGGPDGALFGEYAWVCLG